jgi:hypothetical protein
MGEIKTWLLFNYERKIFHANGSQKKAGVARLISDKLDCKPKARGNNNSNIGALKSIKL